MNINKHLSLVVLIIVFLFSISCVCALENSDANLTSSDDANLLTVTDNDNVENANLTSSDNSNVDKSYVINQRNYKMYFDDNNVLKNKYGGSIITFDGKFNDLGVFTINSPNTKITGKNTLFNNTVFNLKSDEIMLTNLNFVLSKEFPQNEYAGILIKSDNITVYNCNIDYNVPSESTGFAIYSNGMDWGITGTNLINNTINYVGKSYGNGFNYGVILVETFNATVSGNAINCSLPLRGVDWSSTIYGGSSMDSVAALVADTCRYLKLSNNNIYANVNGAKQGEPTLDTVLIYFCPDSIIEKNIIYERDYFTKKGNVNYLYGLDMYLSSNCIVFGNDINIYTTGGKEAHGTAYPIQITGPALNISIVFNNITSYCNGPNIGIFSQNYYGETQLSIISNNINVTGYASGDSWALVAGIEVQDSNDIILNNTINVNSVNEFKSGYNLYGISYSQKTEGPHSYNIQYNKVKTSGDWAVALMGGKSSPIINSIISNNILNTRNKGGNRAVLISGGSGVVKNNTDGSKHLKRFMSYNDYPDFLKHYLKFSYSTSEGLDFSWISNSRGTGLTVTDESGKSSFGVSGSDGKNPFYTKSKVSNGNVNSTHYVPGESGTSLAGASISLAGASAGSGDANPSSESKAYEITKTIKNLDEINYLQIVIFPFICLLLLIIGYNRKENFENY